MKLLCFSFLLWYSLVSGSHVKSVHGQSPEQNHLASRPVINVTFPRPGPIITIKPLVSFRAGALVTVFAAHKKKFLTLPGECTGYPDIWFKEKPVLVLSMGTVGPRYLCTGSDPKSSLFVIISQYVIGGNSYICKPMSEKTGCERASFWWSMWYSWGTDMKSMGVTADDIRLDKLVTVSEAQYSSMVRLFWNVAHNGSLPEEPIAVHSLHGHHIPTARLRAPLMSRGGGAFGAPIWHGPNDPCVEDTLDILFRYKNIIARPCSPIVYDGSGFYVSYPDRLSSTALFNCDHTCGFRFYYGSAARGQIVAYNSWTSTLNTRNKIEGAVLDGW